MGSKRASPPAEDWEPTRVEVESLLLDADNPRLAEHGVKKSSLQEEVLQVLWREMSVDEVALSIAANGFFPHEPVFANSRNIVIEGNRRLAAVKVLLSEERRRQVGAMKLPTLSAAARKQLAQIPVIRSEREDLWRYIGFKHVNGPQNWQSFAKAKYIAWVHNDLKQPLDQIASSIGDRHSTVLRLYNGIQTLEQAEKAGEFHRDDRHRGHFSFSHLYTGLGYSGIQRFLGIAEGDFEKTDPVPRARIKQLGELCLWLYGSKRKDVRPLVQSQNPDLRHLDETIQSDRGISAIRGGLPLRVAVDISRGDDRRFREALVRAKELLQVALGAQVTGYAGEAELLRLGSEIEALAAKLVGDMRGRKFAKRASTTSKS